MKKIASIVTVFIGLVLLVLNYQNIAIETQTELNKKAINTEVKNNPKSEDKSFDVSKINLPSIFDALYRSL